MYDLPRDVPIRELLPQIAEYMTWHRAVSGYDLARRLPPGPNGRPRCRWCGAEVTGRRVSWCNQACVDEYTIRFSSSDARRFVQRRDGGRCAICGIAERRWEADHIVPVCEGGGMLGLSNLRTLCYACHAAETAELARRRAVRNYAGAGVQLRLPLGIGN